jgi:ABC-type maltose transport system permease subunit
VLIAGPIQNSLHTQDKFTRTERLSDIIIRTGFEPCYSVGLFTFQSQRAVEWSVSMMGALLTALPMVLLFLFTQRLFQRGLSSTGLK